MPAIRKTAYFICLHVMAVMVFTGQISAYEGISIYYIRYDIKSSNNRISDEQLVMVPGKNDFRSENFSVVTIKGAISSDRADSKTTIDRSIRDDALKSILFDKGLKSVKAKDYDTVISYEGVVKTPFQTINKTYNQTMNTYEYEARVAFAPTSFPDQWKHLGMKHKFKGLVQDFFQFFK